MGLSWQDIGALATIISLLVIVAGLLASIKRGLIDKAVSETHDRESMNHRVGAIEREQRELGERLATHIEQTREALQAFQKEMPAAVANGVSRAIAETLQLQERFTKELLQSVADRATEVACRPKRKKAQA